MIEVLREGMAAFGRLRLPVTDATLSFREEPGGPPEWSLGAKTDLVRDEDSDWKLYLYGDGVTIEGTRLPLRAGDVFTPPSENERGEPNFTMYVWEHEPAYDIRIAVLHAEAENVRLRVSGKCDVGWSEEFDAGVPFEIHAKFRIEPPRPHPRLVVHR